jgi:hypothetical protein
LTPRGIAVYLARTTTEHPTRFYIRETYQDGNLLKSRNVFDLGTDPSRYIVYPGGRGYYFDEKIEETLQDQGLNPTQDDLDHIFWEFLDPAIKRVINGFQRTRSLSGPSIDPKTEKVHLFDQRRVHYLRFAQIDQHDLSRMSPKLFRHLHHKSRDEIEQHFLFEERILKTRELKRYIWAIFDLNSVFRTACANNPQGNLVQERVDDGFLAALCNLSQDESFWSGASSATGLQEYLIRYAVIYFDHAFPVQTHFRDDFHDFMNRHRRYVPPQKVRMSMEEAGRLFETDWKKLKQMDARTFTRLYRRLAMKHHPDQGGHKRKFIKLTTLYRHLMRKKRN